ncbi:MAG: Vitamin B12 dependent methionine synthase activation protein [Epulopiscium sp.]|nr:Vitamin B12 dependent methionine synthase activation protein [Candidatus Epulonipiscium sp.]
MIVCKKEALRYLGYNKQNIDNNTKYLLDECIEELTGLINKKSVYKIFNIEWENEAIHLEDTILHMESKDIANHLAKSDKCALMAASLGLEVDMKIAFYARTNLSKSLILDACASSAIETYCDQVEETIAMEASDKGYNITSRFSPGYGDLDIGLQKPISQILETYPKMGLTVSENSIMMPRKSVTAIIGWQRGKPSTKINKCKLCNNINCLYRKADNNE